MQKPEQSGGPGRKTNAPFISGLVAVWFASATLSASAGDAVTQLAMNRPKPTPALASRVNRLPTEPVRSAPILKFIIPSPVAGRSKVESNAVPVVPVNPPINQGANPEQDAPLVFTRDNLSDNRSVVVAAGYGCLWDSQCAFKYISPARQEPSCAYLKASINF